MCRCSTPAACVRTAGANGAHRFRRLQLLPPFHYLDDSGDATGFDVQVLRAAVAEGVEDEDTVALLVQKGCDVLQGYCICRPMPADEFVNFSEDFNRQSVQPFAG